MRESILIPSTDYPTTCWAGRAPSHWLMDAERRTFQKNGGHPEYSETDIEYRFNAHGYRSPEFSSYKRVRIVSIGCSYVFGFGLPEEHLFQSVICRNLEKQIGDHLIHWNLALGGASNDYIFRVLSLCLEKLDPQLVLVNFTWPGRREYLTAEGSYYAYLPQAVPERNPVLAECYRHLSSLASTHDDQLNLYRNYKSIEALLTGRTWLFSAINEKVPRMIEKHIDWNRYAGSISDDGVLLDRARDGSHPGRRCHERLAHYYLQKIDQLKWLSVLE